MIKKKAQINFETDNWAVRKYAPIRPAAEFIPDKFKNLPPFLRKERHMVDSVKTVKSCPGIKDYLSLGYIIPAWCDMEFQPEGDNIIGRYSDPDYNHTIHPAEQMGNFLEKTYTVRSPLKLDNPWRIWTAEGWSIMYLPLFYHEEQNWSAAPGIIDHDMGALQSPINLLLKRHEYTSIKQGDPLVQIVPIKREQVTLRTGDLSQTAWLRHKAISSLNKLSFKGWQKYMKEKKIYKIKNEDMDLPE